MPKHSIRRATLTAMVFAALAGSAIAQTPPPGAPPHDPAHRAGPPGVDRPGVDRPGDFEAARHMHRGNRHWARQGGILHMMGVVPLMPGAKIEHAEGRLAFIKAELKLTAAQEAAWNAFAGALRDNAGKLNAVFGDTDRDALRRANRSERMAAMEKSLGARYEALKATRATMDPLYAALTDEQKKVFDRFIPARGGMGPRAHKGHRHHHHFEHGDRRDGPRMDRKRGDDRREDGERRRRDRDGDDD